MSGSSRNKKTKKLKNKQTNKPHWRCWAEADTVHRVSPLPLKYQICGMCTWSSAGTRKWAGPAGPLGLAPRTQSPPDQTSKRLHQRTDPSETFDLKKERTTMSVWNLLDLHYRHSSIYAVNMGTHKKKWGKRKPRKLRFLNSTEGEENRIEL